MKERQCILLADADPTSIADLSSILASHGEVRVARSPLLAHEALANLWHLRAAVVDAGLAGEGSGLGLIAELTRTHPGAPAVLLGSHSRPSAANAAYLLGADYLEKPVDRACIERFMIARLPLTRRLELRTEFWQARYDLSEALRDVLCRAARGENRDTIAAFRSSSPNTVKRQIFDLLQKTGDETLHAAIERLMREAAV